MQTVLQGKRKGIRIQKIQMTLNDHLGNVLSHINNSEKAGKSDCIVKPASKIVMQVLNIMKDTHYIGEIEKIDTGKLGSLKISLLGKINRCNVIKPRYAFKKGDLEKFEKRYLPAKGFGIIIVSTSKGIMVHEKAIELNTGGRLISYVY